MDLTEYRGFKITVDERGTFRVEYNDDPKDHYSTATLDELKGRIDQYLNRKAKARKLSLPVILGTGDRAIATGIHLSQGSITGLPDGYHQVYPEVDWIIAAIDRTKMLRKEMERLQSRIYPYQIKTNYRNQGKNSDLADTYAAALDKLEQEYAEKKAAALADETVEESC